MKQVTIFGGSGFLGKYTTQKFARAAWRVRVAVRRPDLAAQLRLCGNVGQVEPVQANIRDDDSVARAVAGSDVVINLVGIRQETSWQNFSDVHHLGARRVARAAAAAGVPALIHISALGADAESDHLWLRSKGEGEAAILAAFPEAILMRPAFLLGPEEKFLSLFPWIARISPIVPVLAAEAKLQPLDVRDVASALLTVANDASPGGKIYELGGPEVRTMRELITMTSEIAARRRMHIPVPHPLAWLKLQFLHLIPFLNFITPGEYRRLREGAVCSGDYPGLQSLGITPTTPASAMSGYLTRFRPSGQFYTHAG